MQTELDRKIQKCIDDVYDFLDENYEDEDSFFIETKMENVKIRKKVLSEEMTPLCISNWIAKGEPHLTEDQFSDILEKIPVLYIIHELKEKKLIESVETEDSELFFLSQRGIETGIAMGLQKK